MRSKRVLVVWAAALLTALATVTPVAAAPPTGGLTVTVEPSGNMMWANSVGDVIEFDVTVTNTTRGTVSGITLTFPGYSDPISVGNLVRRQSWDGEPASEGDPDWRPLYYTVVEGDLADLTLAVQTEVTIGTAIAEGTDGAGNLVEGTADVVMTAYPVEPCPSGATGGAFTWGPTSADYTVCALTPDHPGYWTFTTTLPKPKKGQGPFSPAVTARDGVPGNWCNYHRNPVTLEIEELPREISADRLVITDHVFFPADGLCFNGGAGGEPIPIRNSDTFYLATGKDNVVQASPDGS